MKRANSPRADANAIERLLQGDLNPNDLKLLHLWAPSEPMDEEYWRKKLDADSSPWNNQRILILQSVYMRWKKPDLGVIVGMTRLMLDKLFLQYDKMKQECLEIISRSAQTYSIPQQYLVEFFDDFLFKHHFILSTMK